MSAADRIEAATLADALRAAGFEHVPERIEPGRTARFPGLGARASDRAGWCVAFADGAGAAWGDWRSGASGTWFADDPRTLPPTERERLRRAAAEAREAAERERETEHRRAAEQARAILDGAPLATAHAYLSRKGIGPHGARIASDGRLLVPVYAPGGSLQSVQYVAEDGAKRFLPGGRLSGGWCRLGPDPRDCPDAPLLLAEGFATAATLTEATGFPVWLAFTANNLDAVAKMLRAQFPDRRLLVCGDDDRATDGNPGRTKAAAAAAAVGADVVFPLFPQDCSGTDFNDMAGCSGQGEVARLITAALEDAKPANEPTAAGIVEAAIAKTLAGDAGALFELDALAALRSLDPPAWARTRARIKAGCRDVSVRELDRALRSGDGANAGTDDSPATAAVRLARESGEYFFDAERTAYASVQGAQARETWRVDGQGFRDWLAALYYRETESGLSDQSLQTAINTLRAVALHDGEEHPVGLRVAACPEGVLIDLGDVTWRAVLVTAAGWRILAADHLPVRLYRTAGMQPLPEPVQAAGDIDRLWTHINVPQADRPLLLAWLLDALRPGTPYPVLELCGPQGAAKSSTQRRLRSLVDPHTVPLRGRPKCAEDIFVAAGAGYLVSYENVSGLHPDMQDALCVLATGGGFATRRFYTNAEEAVIRAHRPVVLNGISANATRPDLIDRLVHIALPEITERKTETEIDAAFAADAGAIFGGLLDLFADALAMLPAVRVAPADLPRLADFGLLGEAMSRARGMEEGRFLRVFTEHRAENMTRALDASPLAQAVVSLIIEAGKEIATETAKRAYERLQDYRPQHSDNPFPQSPKSMMDQLRRYGPALRLLGIVVTEHGRTKQGYTLSIRRAPGDEAAGEPDVCARAASAGQQNYVHHVHHVHPSGGAGERGELGERKNAPPGTPRARAHAAAEVHSSADTDAGELL